MMRALSKRQILGLVSCLLIVVAVGLYFYDEIFDFAEVNFKTYPNLGKDQISEKDYQKTLALHQECFEEVKRRKLYTYLLNTKYADSNDYVQGLIKKQVDAYILSSRQEKVTSFRETANITLIRKGSEVIGLYSCRDEDTVTQGSVMIFNVCLQPSWRGKGYGKAMMNHAISRCATTGRDLTLTVYKDDQAVIKLYERLHFKIIDPPNDPGDDFNYYDKYLMKYINPAQ